MSRRTEYRNEVKIRLDDRTYEGLLAWKALNGIDYASTAGGRAIQLFLFGTVGNLPANLLDRSSAEARFGTEVPA
ncbi:hypothetical protein R69746_05624 [Paraburkholderia aspalathi]|nr:hypothetical protein [Paraburkholderia aspalathi]MBK3841751.1 hypothetical protein [Paraburkholderia aspalathi]CAE6811122.1 hypothetical protein R69746_05624 [Paraburkholderia aspalathi]